MRAAARGVDDDEVDALEGVDQAPGERLSLVEPAGVHRERSAAALRRSHDLEPICREHAGGRGVDVWEGRGLHAAGEQPDPRAPRAARGRDDRDLATPAPLRRELDQRPESARERQPTPQRRQRERSPHPARVREHPEEKPAQETVGERALVLALDRGTGRLDQPVVAHARRAGGQARHAAEAAVEVLDDRGVEGNGAVEARVHEVNAPARRVHLLTPEDVRGTGRQAEPAVDAVRRELADHAASTPFGSSASRIRSTSAATAGSSPCNSLLPGV